MILTRQTYLNMAKYTLRDRRIWTSQNIHLLTIIQRKAPLNSNKSGSYHWVLTVSVFCFQRFRDFDDTQPNCLKWHCLWKFERKNSKLVTFTCFVSTIREFENSTKTFYSHFSDSLFCCCWCWWCNNKKPWRIRIIRRRRRQWSGWFREKEIKQKL